VAPWVGGSRISPNSRASGGESFGGVMSELERHKGQEPKRGGGPAALYLAFGIGFVVAAVMVIATAAVLAAGVGFVIPAAIFFGLAANDFKKKRHAFPPPET